MNAVIKLPEGYTNVFVYNQEGELRGYAKNQSVNGEDLSFMTLAGDSKEGEELIFYIGDGDSEKQTSKSIHFIANSLLGTVSNPYIIDENSLDLTKYNFLLYPNSIKDGFVYLDFYARSNQKSQVIIHNVLNQLLSNTEFSIKKGHNLLKLPVNLKKGIYLLNINIDGIAFNNKLIIK
jgi:hypothetical protein